jgi:hypothetical protein
MTEIEVYRMARQSGIDSVHQYDSDTSPIELLNRFAKLVAQHERDRMCEQCKWRNHENTTHNEAN